MSLMNDGTPLNPKDINEGELPIDRMVPESRHHAYVLDYIVKRIVRSEDEMGNFYSRWQVNERKFQAYMSLPKYEKMLKEMNDKGLPPAPAIIVYPYQYAVISTIVSYLARVFCGRKPMFPLLAASPEAAQNMEYMQAMLQFNVDQARLTRHLYQHFFDGEMYGVGAMRLIWKEDRAKRATFTQPTGVETFLGFGQGGQPIREMREKIIFQGNDVKNIDPYMFLPDPSVPMSEVARRGEYVFWRDFTSRHAMMQEQSKGALKWTDQIEPMTNTASAGGKWWTASNRSLLTSGKPSAGAAGKATDQASTYMLDQGTIDLIPAELGLGTEETLVRYLVSIVNKKQIVQLQPIEFSHGNHPIVVSEPYTMGYGFGQPGITDYLGPLQDIISWFVDSHIYNVRAALQNMFVYDPSRIEGQDIKKPGPGKLIRAKPAAYGQDIRQMFQQVPVQDVTRSHMDDLNTFIKIGDNISAVNDNMRGTVQSGGRKTATEIRVTGEEAASRLAGHAQLYSAQGITDLVNCMVLNIQEFQTQEIYAQVIGAEHAQSIMPFMLAGDFNYQVSDGSLPFDKAVMLDSWKEILFGVAQSPELSAQYDLAKIFEFVAEIGGAPNIKNFRRQIVPQLMPGAQVQQQAQQGNLVPVNPGAFLNGPQEK